MTTSIVDIERAKSVNLLALIGGDVNLRKVASTNGGEYAGPYPFCGGRDRFRIWPEQGRYWCRQCGGSGDAIEYVRQRDHLTFAEAVTRLNGNDDGTAKARQQTSRETKVEPLLDRAKWRNRAEGAVKYFEQTLWEPKGKPGMDYLRSRALREETLRRFRIGFNTKDQWDDPGRWGLTGKKIYLPAGIVIPRVVDGEIRYVKFRRLNVPKEDRYIPVRRGEKGLFFAGDDETIKPVILVEGEIDALTIWQEAGEMVVAAATGSASGGRDAGSVATLAQVPLVVVAFDDDDEGNKSAKWWLNVLPSAKRRRAWWGDANAMAQDVNGEIVRLWVELGCQKRAPRMSLAAGWGWTEAG
jgi:DNA primase